MGGPSLPPPPPPVEEIDTEAAALARDRLARIEQAKTAGRGRRSRGGESIVRARRQGKLGNASNALGIEVKE